MAQTVQTGLKPLETKPGEKPPIWELMLHARYMMACLWVDAENLAPDEIAEIGSATPATEADTQANELKKLLLDHGTEVGRGERAAMDLTVLTHRITTMQKGASQPAASEIEAMQKEVCEVLPTAAQGAGASSSAPPLTAAAYYDAACAYSLLGAAADAAALEALSIHLSARARLHLKTAFSATPAAQQNRFTAMALIDPTLAFVRTATSNATEDPSAAFNDAVGRTPPAGAQKIDVTLHLAGSTSGSDHH